MTERHHPFHARSRDDLADLMREQPLAWIVSGSGTSFRASLMPFRPWKRERGVVTHLASHLPRWNDQVALLRDDPAASLLFLGPNAYISPTWVGDRTWAPTWNFASARVDVEIEFRDDPAELRAILEDLVNAMEIGRAGAWRIDEMGERYTVLSKRIVGFIAHVKNVDERYKLGQDERPDVFAGILEGLETAGKDELRNWMERFHAGRDGGAP